MGRVSWKAAALLAPVPAVLVTCGDERRSNVLTVAWTGILCTHPPKTYISLRPERHSYSIIKDSGSFVINLVTRPLVPAADWCGMKSGRDHDKFLECRLEQISAPDTGCPMLDASPVCIECRLERIIELGSHHMFLADIVSVHVDESLLDRAGKLRLDRADLVAFAHGSYYALGEYLGDIGQSIKKKKHSKR